MSSSPGSSDYRDHLSRITTMWTLVADAHGDRSAAIEMAQQKIIERYSGAVYRYLLSVLRDPDAADEVFQEFALRLMKGGFRHADRDRGRFRDYVKTAVLRLVTDHYRRRRRRDPLQNAANVLEGVQVAGEEPDPAEAFDQAFRASCRDEFLARAWMALQLIEETQGQPCYSVLDHRARNPQSSSDDMAADLTARLQPEAPFTSTGIRKALQRAREKFSELLLYEVGQASGASMPEDLEAEIIELGLQPYCQTALAKRQGGGPRAE